MKKIILLIIITLLALSAYRFYGADSPTQPAPSPSITAEAPTLLYEFTAGTDQQIAYDLLKEKVELKTKDFGDAGLFVDSVNGLGSDGSHYWAFYINGEYAQTSISKTILKQGDTIMLKYEAITQ